MKIAILCSDDPHHNFLVELLCQHFNVVDVVVESSAAQFDRLWQKKRYLDWIYRHYHSFRRRINGHSRYRQAFFATDQQKLNLGESIVVESIVAVLWKLFVPPSIPMTTIKPFTVVLIIWQ